MGRCMWCGHITKWDKNQVKMKAAIVKHLLECKDHPLAKRIAELVAENEQLKAAGVGYSQQTVDALTAERDKLQAENAQLKNALQNIMAEGNKPDTQFAADEGLDPNPHTMSDIAEQALKKRTDSYQGKDDWV